MLVREERLSDNTRDRLLAWNPSGFSVFVGEPIAPYNNESRERLARYLVKPAIALERFFYNPETCRVTVHSTRTGMPRELTALDFLAELSVHVPDHGEHTVLYYGRASNRSRGERKKAEALAQPVPKDSAHENSCPDEVIDDPSGPSRKTFRMTWAALLKRVWDIDALRCPRCQGQMRMVSAILKANVIVRILATLGLSQHPRAPDPHDCEERDPDIKARHPLLNPKTAADSPTDWSPIDPDPGWPMDAPHSDD